MRAKHNKKRNIALVYEALVKEATVSILKGDKQRRDTAINIIKRHFRDGTELKKELDCVRSLSETRNADRLTSEKILKEVKLQKMLIDPESLFSQQSGLIRDINKDLDPDVFGNFVPNYKTLATINQMFSTSVTPKQRVILESSVIEHMMSEPEKTETIEEIDDITLKTFASKFNEKYQNELLEEQKTLLTHYISSFSNNGLELKMFLNEEISRLKATIVTAQETDVFESDTDMTVKAAEVLERLSSFSEESEMNEGTLLTILKTQSLVKEINNDADQD